MGAIGEIIAASNDMGIGYAERLLTDIKAEDFGKFARPGGEVVTSNHPAFIYGHLSLYPKKVISNLDQDASSVEPSEAYTELFSPKATCVDDPDATIYPAKDELVEKMVVGYRKVSEALRAADDDLFTRENPAEGRMKELFPTNGAALGFYVGGHVMIHMGQLSAWRRAMGLGAA